MSQVTRNLERARSAFDKPTLRLLNQTGAPYIIAVFSTLLPAEATRMPAELFHAKVDAALETLRAVSDGTSSPPDGTARELCRRWVKQSWLWRGNDEDKVEEYGLTSHAQEALEYVNRLAGTRAVFGESRIRTILDAAQYCATAATGDRHERIRRLQGRIEEDTRELNRLLDGGEIETATDDQLMDAYLNLAGLLSALPSDFLRVSEAFKDIHRKIVADLRSEQRSPGEVLDSYLDHADTLMGASLEGRAFRGAVELLRDDRLLTELRGDLDAILEHDFTEVLNRAEKDSLRQTVSGIRRGIETVLAERRRLSVSLSRNIRRYDLGRDRDLDATLQAISAELTTWTATASSRARIPLDVGVPRIDIGHLPMRAYDPTEHAPPVPLAQHTAPDSEDLRADARAQGGPNLPGLRAQVQVGLAAVSGGHSVTAAQIFNALGDADRRPVELLGLVHTLADLDAAAHAADGTTEQYVARRPDGSLRVFIGPALHLSATGSAAPGKRLAVPPAPPSPSTDQDQASTDPTPEQR